MLLGLATARQLLGVVDVDTTLTVPWAGLAAIVAVPLAASLAATSWPAARAGAIRPAVAYVPPSELAGSWGSTSDASGWMVPISPPASKVASTNGCCAPSTQPACSRRP